MISFVVPIYKKPPDVVKRSIESLLDMSYKDIEIVCVYDGPDNEVQAALEPIAKDNPKIKQLVIEHGGASKARNKGFALTTGQYVSFWDCDCYAEPGMAKVWNMFFERYPDADFVYSGYKWTDESIPGYESEQFFDPWIIKKYNFLCGMWPLKREKVVEWDESLTGLQDWDYWRRVIECGAKGYYNRGFGFSTEFPDHTSISGQGEEVKKERILTIRKKYGDPDCDILVAGFAWKKQAIRTAKLLGADYFANPTFYVVKDYKLILSMGFHSKEINEVMATFNLAGKDTKKAIYWMGIDAEEFRCGPFFQIKRIVEQINKQIAFNFCPDIGARNILEEMGIKATIAPFPREDGQLLTSLPEKFRVLAFFDDNYQAHAKAIQDALPDVQIDNFREEKRFELSDYTVIMHFSSENRLNDGSRNALIQGRYLISNIEAPHCGYVDASNPKQFKEKVINKILALKDVKELNTKARLYYLEDTSPEKFKERILKLMEVPA